MVVVWPWFWGRPACGCGVALPVVVFVVSCDRDCGRRCLRLWRRPGSCLRLRVSCLRAFASACLYANGDSPAPASAWLSGQGSSLCVSCVVSCVRCELLAVRAQEPWRVCRLGDVTYTRFAQLGLRLRGSVRFEVRGRRVCLWLRPLYCLSLCVFYVCLLTY